MRKRAWRFDGLLAAATMGYVDLLWPTFRKSLLPLESREGGNYRMWQDFQNLILTPIIYA